MCFVFIDCLVLCFVSVQSTHCFVVSPFWPFVSVLVFGLCFVVHFVGIVTFVGIVREMKKCFSECVSL